MNIENYKNDGWGLSRLGFQNLFDILSKNKNQKTIVEFGSGMSTKFFLDALDGLEMNSVVYSFDDSTEYSYKGVHPKLNLRIVELIETSDDRFEKMFVDKTYDINLMQRKVTPLHTRQKNTFYNVGGSIIPENIDLLLVDGPHGNGRSLAFLHTYNKLHQGSIVFIDDSTHYPFYDHLNMLYPLNRIIVNHVGGKGDKWTLGGDFVIVEIL